MESLFLTILSVSLTTSIVIIAIIILGGLINKHYAAKWKYLLWIALALRLLIPFNGNLTDSNFIIEIPAEVGNMQMSEVLESESLFLDGEFIEQQNSDVTYTNLQTWDLTSVKPSINYVPKFSITFLQALSYLWATGIIIMLLWQLIGFSYYKRRILKRGKAVSDPMLLAQLSELSHELGVQRNITFIMYEKADSPMMVGFRNPVLVIPNEEYTQNESFYILKHELIHLKRHDIFARFLLLLVRDIHWFNPVIYLMHRAAVVDMELACDEAVVEGCSYNQREAYTETLMSTLSSQKHKSHLLSTQFSREKRVMKKRFKNILTKVKKKNGVIMLAVIITLTVIVGAMASLVVGETVYDGSKDKSTTPSVICTLQQKDIAVEPQVKDYSFDDAKHLGEVRKIDGILPGAGMGTWYIANIEGVEYYYGKYDLTENCILYGWSLVDETHELTNGIKLGMSEKDILERLPNMAVVDFNENFVYDEVAGFMGWNRTAYPRSNVGMDSEWEYGGKDYCWTDQFDYIMVADIDQDHSDALPIYLGLLMKDNAVAAITFYNPTAG